MRSRRVSYVAVATATLMITVGGLTAAGAATLPPGGSFQDDNGSVHEPDIEAIHAAGITNGCGPNLYCPGQPVIREQMAAFLARALKLPATSVDHFTDDSSSPFQDEINRIATAGITVGCGGSNFCPKANITRGEMAAFLVRAFSLPPSSTDHFSDDNGSPFEADINSLAASGITSGCGPNQYCPHAAVTRDQMASFLTRALGLTPIVPPPATSLAVALYVDVAHPSASDSNPGTGTSPKRTIQAAIDAAATHRSQGRSVHVIVRPGVYREHLQIGHSPAGSPEMLIESSQTGAARVVGTDRWSGWTQTSPGIYSREWPFTWGTNSSVEPIVGRREVVFVGGQRLYQVLSSGALTPGTFFVEESARRIHIAVSGGAPQAVDVAVRPMTLDINGARNLTVKGFEFSGAASPFERSSVRIVNARDVAFADNIVRENSWVGVSLVTSQDLTVSGNLVESNGGGGMTIYQVGQLKLLGNETSRNNWRGVRGDFVGWSIGAVKMLGSHGALIDGHVSRDNHTRGFWADYDITDLTIRNSVFCGNLTDGLFIEAAQGPVSVTNTITCDNGRYGVLISNGRHVQLSGNTMCRNATSGLRLDSDGSGGRTITTATGNILLAGADHLTMTNNTFGASPRLIDSNLPSGQWTEFVNTLNSNGNRFVTGAQVAAFRFQGSTGTLANWQTATGEDGSSSISASGC